MRMHFLVFLKLLVCEWAPQNTILIEELEAITKKFVDERRSIIVPDVGEVSIEDLIEDDEPRDEEQEIINTNNIAPKQKYRKTILEKFGDTLLLIDFKLIQI